MANDLTFDLRESPSKPIRFGCFLLLCKTPWRTALCCCTSSWPPRPSCGSRSGSGWTCPARDRPVSSPERQSGWRLKSLLISTSLEVICLLLNQNFSALNTFVWGRKVWNVFLIYQNSQMARMWRSVDIHFFIKIRKGFSTHDDSLTF